MIETAAPAPQFSDKERRALQLAAGRSLSEVKETGSYFHNSDPQKDADLYREFWDIAVFYRSKGRKPEDIISLLQKRNKKLDSDQAFPLETMQDIIDLAYLYIRLNKTYDTSSSDEEDQARHLPYFERDGKLYLTCISPEDRYSYAHLEGGKVVFSPEERDPMGMVTVPPELPVHQDRGTTVYIVGIPRKDLLESAVLLSPGEMYSRIRDHLYIYLDAPEPEYELFTYYILYSWHFSKCGTTPYLRLIGDTGKGKSRFLKVISDLCFYPIKASGSSSLSGIMRFKEKWQGTLIIDESDLKGDQSDPLIKYLNLGFEKDNPFLLTDKSDVSNTHIFDPFGPKLIAMRQPFRDQATEGRCLSFSPDETTREDIPPELPSRYFEEVADIRALITRFTFEHWNEVSEDCMLSCSGMQLEGRLKQMSRPLSIILRLFPDGEERFRAYLRTRQKEIKQTRAESWEGSMFNLALDLATMQEDVMSDPEFGKFYYGGRIQAVLPKMIANSLKVSPKAVTRALEGIGMEIRYKRITIQEKTGARSKSTRYLLVPNRKKWAEIVQRYYYNEEGGNPPDCPECLRGPEYNTRQAAISNPASISEVSSGSVTSVTTVTKPDGEINPVTYVTDVTHYLNTPIDEIEPDPDLPVTLVTNVTFPVETPHENFHDWLNYHQIPEDITPDQYTLMPESQRADVSCKCRGCGKPGRDYELYYIPARLYQQICADCLNEFKALYEEENRDTHSPA